MDELAIGFLWVGLAVLVVLALFALDGNPLI